MDVKSLATKLQNDAELWSRVQDASTLEEALEALIRADRTAESHTEGVIKLMRQFVRDLRGESLLPGVGGSRDGIRCCCCCVCVRTCVCVSLGLSVSA